MQKHLIENTAARREGRLHRCAGAQRRGSSRSAAPALQGIRRGTRRPRQDTAAGSRHRPLRSLCEHLIVRESHADRIVGTYRILSPDAARRVGSYYSEERVLHQPLQNLRSRMVEVGRSCIHPDHRSGAVITLLWAGLAEYMVSNNYDYLMGCASIGMADGGHNAANLFAQIAPPTWPRRSTAPFPLHGLPFERLANGQPALVPPLIKGYLRVGAWVCGEPAWDPDFNTADLLLLLPDVAHESALHAALRQSPAAAVAA
jgi:putative hemolysin